MKDFIFIFIIALVCSIVFVFVQELIRSLLWKYKINKLKVNDLVTIITYEGQKRCIIKYIGEGKVHYTIIGDHERRYMVADVEDIIV